jgi:hypothetical protein
MPKKSHQYIAVGLFVFFIIIMFSLSGSNLNIKEEQVPTLTESQAIALMGNLLLEGGCIREGLSEVYQKCNLDIISNENDIIIQVIYDGFFDDSVRGARLRAQAFYENGSWMIKGEPQADFKCWENRGHQDFSQELCI